MLITELDQYKRGHLPPAPDYPANTRTFYAPADNVHGALKALINSCQASIIVAMYGYDDMELAGLIAHLIDNPAIHCQITLDKSQAAGTQEKRVLNAYHAEMTSNSVAIGTSERGAIMHRKMMLIDGMWRVSGSTNWSLSGETLQDNELTVIQSAAVTAEARTVLDLEHVKALTQMGATT